MEYKIFKLILNIIFVAFWQNYGFQFLIQGLEVSGLAYYFTNMTLYMFFYVSLMLIPPIWFTYELWFRLRKNN